MKIIDPVAPRRANKVLLAKSLTTVAGATIGLIDNSKPGATEVLKGLRRALEDKGSSCDYRRKRHPVMAAPFLREMSKTCKAVVIAIGDCGSGTSWSMQDLISLESQQVPVALMVIEQCRDWALAEARASGLLEPRLVVVKGEVEFLAPEEVESIGAAAAEEVVRSLTKVS
jgi:hypothetical protein